jgi:hypothetical protein
MDETESGQTDNLLPYAAWYEEALRQVVVQALEYVAREGLPGEHHFYLTFRTDYPGVVVPARVLARYPHEMTIVLQHQFWDLKVDRKANLFSVGLSFGGVGSILVIPFGALTGFADPHAQFQLPFEPVDLPAAGEPDSEPAPVVAVEETAPPEPAPEEAAPQVVSLDAFRRRTPPKE